MKPFVAITVLVAASLTAASAAPNQQQVARGSSGLGQGPSLSGSFSTGGSLSGAGLGSLPGGFASPGQLGGSGGGGASGPHSGNLQGQWSSAGSYWGGSYPRVQGPVYYYQGYYPGQGYGQSFYGPRYYDQGYGNGAVWGSSPVYGYGSWGSWPGYGSGYGGFFPTGYGAYGSLGSGFGSVGAGQRQAPLAAPTLSGGASGSSSSLQSPARSQ